MEHGIGIAVAGVATAMVATFGAITVVGSMGNGGLPSCSTTTNTSTSTAPQASSNASLFAAIKVSSSGNVELTLAKLFGTNIESGWDPNASNADGGYGYYRIQQPVGNSTGTIVHRNITVAQANNPADATNYMDTPYRNATNFVNKTYPGLWTVDPETAVEKIAFNAERPYGWPTRDYIVTRKQAAVDRSYAKAVTALQSMGLSVTSSSVVEAAAETSSATSTSETTVACATTTTSAATIASNVPAKAQRSTVVTAATNMLGVQYVFAAGNAKGPSRGVCAGGLAANDCNKIGLDCSGLVLYAFSQVGINFAHLAAAQWTKTKSHTVVSPGQSLTNAQPGDLVFFTGSDGSFSAPGHVGIYVGNGKMINAPHHGTVVRYADISSKSSSFVGITDPFYLAL